MEAAPSQQKLPAWETSVTQVPRRRLRVTAAHAKTRRPISILIVALSVSIALIAVVPVWWFYPRPWTDICSSYVAIYEELQQSREATSEQPDWVDFRARAKTQLDKTVPWLEEQAKPRDRTKSLLLYAGRDLQKLLDIPRDLPNPHQKRMSAFVEQPQELYDSN